MTHAVSVYGKAKREYITKEYTCKRHYWKRRSDGVRQRYLKKVTVKGHTITGKARETRFTFYGDAKECKDAVQKMRDLSLVPIKQFADRINAYWFLHNPLKYGTKGEWEYEDERESP